MDLRVPPRSQLDIKIPIHDLDMKVPLAKYDPYYKTPYQRELDSKMAIRRDFGGRMPVRRELDLVALQRLSTFSITQIPDGHDLYGKEDPDIKRRSKFRIAMILSALYLSLFIAALDVTIIATAVPIITDELGSAAGYIWIGGAYLVANVGFAPIWVKFSDIWGRKPIFLAANLVCIASSIACAMSQNMKTLIISRSVQGAAGGGLICLTNVAISDLFSVRERSLYLGFCEGIWAVSGAVGPLLGGVFAEKVSWRWCFWCNLPVAGTAFVLTVLFLDVHNPRTPVWEGIKAIDWLGCLSILGSTVMLLLGLQLGGAVLPWSSATVVCLIVFGTLMVLAFMFVEKKVARYPVLPLALFGKVNAPSLLVTFFHGVVFIAAEYYLPLYFQAVRGESPLQSGVLLVPLIVSTAGVGVLAGIYIHRTGEYRSLMWIGSILLTLGNGLFILLNPDTSLGPIICFELLAGVGSGLLFEPPLIAVQQNVDQDDVGTATSTQNFIRNLGIAIGVILGGIIFQQGMDLREPNLRDAGLSDKLLNDFSGKNAGANVHVPSELPTVQELAVREAYSFSIRTMFIIFTIISAFTVISSFMVKKTVLSREHKETVTGIKK